MPKRGCVYSFLLAACVTLTACGGTDSNESGAAPSPDAQANSADAGEAAETAVAAETVGEPQPSVSTEGAGISADVAVRRELGLSLRSESDVPTNLLPPVEVHDVGQDRMVNFKNIFPAEQPVLLWMWAPF